MLLALTSHNAMKLSHTSLLQVEWKRILLICFLLALEKSFKSFCYMEFCLQFCVLLHRVMCSDLEFRFEFIIILGTLPICFCFCFAIFSQSYCLSHPLSSYKELRREIWRIGPPFHKEGLISQSLSRSKYLGHIERSRYACNCESLLIFFSQNGGIIFCCSLKGKQGLRRIVRTSSNSTPDQVFPLVTYASNFTAFIEMISYFCNVVRWFAISNSLLFAVSVSFLWAGLQKSK